jgi:hypothetical protein
MSKNTCGDYNDPSKEYQKVCGGYRKQHKKQQKKVGGKPRSDEQPLDPLLAKRQKGGTMQYPFEPEFHDYPIPNKVDFKVDDGTNIVNPVDLFGCKLLDKDYYTTPSIKGGNYSGGDCGCASTSIKLGGSREKQKKQKAGGNGYNFDLEHPITNMPAVVSYSTGGYMNSSSNTQNKYLLEISKKKTNHSSNNVGMQGNQKGGSAASDSLMEYFLDFQHRCRGSEIY